jgi:hypothetical protein
MLVHIFSKKKNSIFGPKILALIFFHFMHAIESGIVFLSSALAPNGGNADETQYGKDGDFRKQIESLFHEINSICFRK